MLERMHDLPGHVSGLRATGKVDKEDYRRVLGPLIDDAKREARPVRLLYELGDGFKGITPAAVLEDARLGLRSVGTVERMALVTDRRWMRGTTRAVGSLFPCPVRSFTSAERGTAIDWLSQPAEHSGLSHRVAHDGRVLHVVVHGAIAAEDFDALALTVDHLTLDTKRLEGVVVELKAALSWQDIGSFLRHIAFVRARHTRVQRLALVTDSRLGTTAAVLASRLLTPEAHCFGRRDLDLALRWATTGALDPQEAARALDRVQQAGVESFPASDPPSFTPEA